MCRMQNADCGFQNENACLHDAARQARMRRRQECGGQEWGEKKKSTKDKHSGFTSNTKNRKISAHSFDISSCSSGQELCSKKDMNQIINPLDKLDVN